VTERDAAVGVIRGRADDLEEDLAVTGALLEDVRASGRPAVRAWTPGRQVAFGRRDVRADGYERARRAARERGFRPVERRVGGRAVAYTGSTVAAIRADPVDGGRDRGIGGIDARYDRAVAAVERALTGLGAAVVRGEPPEAFCPGAHSLSVSPDAGGPTWPTGEDGPGDRERVGGKVAGVAQRLRRGVALTAAVVVVSEVEAVAGVLDPVYEALSTPFAPATVGSVAAAGGPAAPTPVARALEAALVAGRERAVERLR